MCDLAIFFEKGDAARMYKQALHPEHVDCRSVFKNIGAGLSLVDNKLRIVWVNSVFEKWFGGRNGPICGKYCYAVYQHKAHPCRGCPTLKVFRSGHIEQAIQPGFSQDGAKHYFQLTVSPVKDKSGKVVQALELIDDITAGLGGQKRADCAAEELKRSYEYLLLANRKLQGSIERLRRINSIIARRKNRIYKKYCHKIKELNIAREELSGIIKINNACGLSLDSGSICGLITRLTCKIMHAEACIIRLFDERADSLVVEGERGLRANNLNSASLKPGESFSGRAAKYKHPVTVNDLAKEDYAEIIKRRGLCSAVAMPMVAKGKVLGVVTVYARAPRHFTEEEIKPLTAFVSQAAVAVQEIKLSEDIHTTYFNTIRSLVLAMEARDPYTRGHADRVTRYSIEIAQELELSEHDIEILRYAGEVHDVGKIAISDLILNKPGKLTPTERATIEVHPVRGAEMIEPLQFLKSAIPLVRHHHERYDGKGYPDGLVRDKIPIMARIMACADAFDAMTSNRPYRRNRMSIEQALGEIKSNSGSQFDPKVAKVFIKIIKKI